MVERLYRIVSTSFTFHNILKNYFMCPFINTVNFSIIFPPFFFDGPNLTSTLVRVLHNFLVDEVSNLLR